jgi:hypothetical protein
MPNGAVSIPPPAYHHYMMKKQISKPITQLSFKDPTARQSKVPGRGTFSCLCSSNTCTCKRNVNQVFINYALKRACNDAAACDSIQFQFYSDQKVYYRILHRTINYNFTESNEN